MQGLARTDWEEGIYEMGAKAGTWTRQVSNLMSRLGKQKVETAVRGEGLYERQAQSLRVNLGLETSIY